MNESAQSGRQIFINGELTIYTASEWRDKLVNEMTGNDDIQLELAEVSEIDSAGLQLLLAVQRQAAGEGRQLQFGQCSSVVRALLDFAQLMQSLNVNMQNLGQGEQP
ncbi:STAS domain-containing protein [Quatrionicoccus australiensis]|uniref:STAS domain-containing protein n=1 Tax=Quatrionicoccus australiensis TaxID=138118 RepID=UPI001CFB891F|nr:STAS domain-containing protein [Quatrionicoccus australiensis]MCB4360576.1 STAS domain-containing protein [Quatrionicoccus australiensis]